MKKISILALHLSFGGVESSIINQANMLCDKYEVTLVSIYKIGNRPAFYVNPKVKVIYLMDLLPNREEFKSSIKSLNPLKIIKEGYHSIKVLYLKKSLIKKYIKKTDSDIIISTRIEITSIVNNYAKGKIKICEEHRHHNNDIKYIKKLYKATTNIDYLINVSKELNDFYSNNLKVKCIYIPNSLDSFPKEKSKLNNKRIVSVGRLSFEKGFADLIDVFKIINDLDKETTLDIIGDGKERQLIEEKIKEYNLGDKVILHGFRNKDYINRIYLNSSLYLMCSYEESFGIVLIESGSYGLPSIAFSSASGAKEIIKDNQSGYLIDNRDKNLMATKALEILNDKNKREFFSENAILVSKEYSFERVKEKLLDFMERFN